MAEIMLAKWPKKVDPIRNQTTRVAEIGQLWRISCWQSEIMIMTYCVLKTNVPGLLAISKILRNQHCKYKFDNADIDVYFFFSRNDLRQVPDQVLHC